jgi:hypothetical protein
MAPASMTFIVKGAPLARVDAVLNAGAQRIHMPEARWHQNGDRLGRAEE